MIDSLRISQIYVLDQDQALDFYVNTLGLEKNTDEDLGFMRFLTVSVPGDKDRQILLEKPAPPIMDEKTADQVRDLLTKGRTGGNLFFTTKDAKKAHEDLRKKGVEFSQELTEQPYGIDFGLRDPFGNHVRIAQMREAAVSTQPAKR
jgi:predicted enzyme related to lactoylglutathione lyase